MDSPELWRSFADSIPDMVLLVGRDGRVRYINHAPPNVPREAVIGASAFSFVPREAEAEVREAFAAILRGAGTRTDVQRAIHPDGSERWYQLHTGPVIVGGEVVSAIIVARDVTETRQAKLALAESEARFRTLVEHAPEAIVVFDVDSEQFVDANQKACDLFGVTLDALKQQNPGDLSPPYQPDGQASDSAARSRIEAALAGGVPVFEWVHRTQFGRDFRCEVRLVRLPSSRRLIRGSIIDVTERRRLEEQVREGRKMDALGQLAAGIAHDFNNVLAVVNGSAQLILQIVDERSTIHADVLAILDASRRGVSLTSQLLTFARREKPPTELIDLNEVVQDIASLAGRLIAGRITIVKRLDPKGAPVLVNRTQLEQVVMNLMLNARDAMRGGLGSIAISTEARRSTTCLRVADSGVGMTEEVRRRIFEPFFTTKGGTGGTGLGLSTVYAIVANAGGTIEVDSTPGVGSAFALSFPTADRAASEAGIAPA